MHWILVIIVPDEKIVVIVDPLRRSHDDVSRNCKRWYQDEANSRFPQEFVDLNTHNWVTITANTTNNNRIYTPLQIDNTSCGVLAAMMLYYYVQYGRLPSNEDFTCAPQHIKCLRLFMLHEINRFRKWADIFTEGENSLNEANGLLFQAYKLAKIQGRARARQARQLLVLAPVVPNVFEIDDDASPAPSPVQGHLSSQSGRHVASDSMSAIPPPPPPPPPPPLEGNMIVVADVAEDAENDEIDPIEAEVLLQFLEEKIESSRNYCEESYRAGETPMDAFETDEAMIEALKVIEQNQNILAAEENNTHRAQYSSISSTREKDPLNEFEENDRVMLETFALLFFLGEGWVNHGSASLPFLLHLMNQHDRRFELDIHFVMSAANQLQRHSALRAVAARAVRGKNGTFEEICTLANSADFKQKLQEAVDNPTSKAAESLSRKFQHLVHLGSHKTPWSGAQRKALMSDIYAYSYFFGEKYLLL